jgi:hypothetical protein
MMRSTVSLSAPRQREPAWWLVLGIIAAAVVGRFLTEGTFLLRLDDAIGFETTAPREIAWSILAIIFGGVLGFVFPRWWYLAPIAGSSLDLVLTFSTGLGNLWPFALGLRLFWMLLVLCGAFMGKLARRRYRAGEASP